MKTRIMIVDDCEELRFLLSRQLSELGAEATAAFGDGVDLHDRLFSARPHLLFLDINMPQSNGLKLAAEVNERHPHVYLVMISADHHNDNVLHAKHAGAHDFLAKPYSMENLQKILDRYRQWKADQPALRIVIADDEELARDYLNNMLAQLSLSVAYEAASGADALDAVRIHRPDMLFLDIEMPDVNGIDVLKTINKSHPGCFTVMVSGHSTFDNLKNAMDHGAAGFIVKPFTRKKLEQIIKLYQRQTPAAASGRA